MTILITGIAGYLGSATAAEFLKAGHKVVGIDNLSGKNKKAISYLRKYYELEFYEIQMSNDDDLDDVLSKFKIDVVFHFAATSNENFSKKDNLAFYENNIVNLFKLLKAMQKHKINNLIYPSSIFAEIGLNSDSSYVKTKIIAENMIKDYAVTNPNFSYAILRYCNIAGYYSNIFLGEFEHYSILKNITRLACNKEQYSQNFTYDEDYYFVHIDDVVKINLIAANKLLEEKNNIKTTIKSERKVSVSELVEIMQNLTHKEIDLTIALKNPKATEPVQIQEEQLYELKYSIEDICKNQLEHEARF